MENLNETSYFLDIMFIPKLHKIESDDSIERYIVPLDAIIVKLNFYKDLMEKGNQNTKIYHFSSWEVIRKEFNKLGQSIC